MKILLFQQHKFGLWNPPDWVADELQKRFPQTQVVHPATPEAVLEEIADAEVAVGATLTPQHLAAARKLRWLHSPAAAVHQYMYPEFLANAVVLTNGRSVFAAAVAEHVIALIFALARQIPACVRFQDRNTWGQQLLWESKPGVRDVAGATLGMVGMGAIGVEVVRRASALGMKVVAVRQHPEKPAEGISAVFGPQDLGKLLAQSDFTVLAAPVTPATKHLIGAAELARMKPDGYLVNVGRGVLIDEVSLADALRAKRIVGAALDVFEEEPLPPGSPLWALENLLITPHCGGFVENLWQRHVAVISENLRRYVAGEPLLGLVDKSQGY